MQASARPGKNDKVVIPREGRPGGLGLRIAGLFAGIAGIELGLQGIGEAEFFCEIDPAAQRVLRARFPDVPIAQDVRELRRLPTLEMVAAGFPCTDLSQAGRTRGIAGSASGLVSHVFELVERARRRPPWLLLENVPFMLHLDRGAAMRYLTESLGDLGYRWAYRVVDTRAFGLPQRRKRVVLLASTEEDPRGVLLADDAGPAEPKERAGHACGFYWTEGIRGLGWAVDAIPTLKGGSTVGIPSPPAIWMPDDRIVTPDIRDAERLQGFEADWTAPAAHDGVKRGVRWKLVGNAVSVPVFRWVGDRIARPGAYERAGEDRVLQPGDPWPVAAWGEEGKAFRSEVTTWPTREPYRHLLEFLRFPLLPLSARACEGFLSRAARSRLRFPDGLLDAVARHRNRMSEDQDLGRA